MKLTDILSWVALFHGILFNVPNIFSSRFISGLYTGHVIDLHMPFLRKKCNPICSVKKCIITTGCHYTRTYCFFFRKDCYFSLYFKRHTILYHENWTVFFCKSSLYDRFNRHQTNGLDSYHDETLIISRLLKLSNVELRQYLDGQPLANARYCKLVCLGILMDNGL